MLAIHTQAYMAEEGACLCLSQSGYVSCLLSVTLAHRHKCQVAVYTLWLVSSLSPYSLMGLLSCGSSLCV